jgi:hypothetical protein
MVASYALVVVVVVVVAACESATSKFFRHKTRIATFIIIDAA